MKRCLVAFIIVLNFGCLNNQTDVRIIEFEKVLGERKTKSLNLLVLDFEKNLSKVYHELSIEKAYTQYLKDIAVATKEDGDKFLFQSYKTRLEFHKSRLWDEIYERDEEYGLGTKAAGKLIAALFTLEHSDSLVNKFRKNRQDAGILSNDIFMRQTLSSNPDFSNYFHKRVVVLNYSY